MLSHGDGNAIGEILIDSGEEVYEKLQALLEGKPLSLISIPALSIPQSKTTPPSFSVFFWPWVISRPPRPILL